MKLTLTNSSIEDIKNEVLCIPVYKENENNELSFVNKSLDNLVNNLIDKKQVSYKIASFTNIYSLSKLNVNQVVLYGMGSKLAINYEKIRYITGELSRYLNSLKIENASIILPGENIDNLEFSSTVDAVAQGFLLGSYN